MLPNITKVAQFFAIPQAPAVGPPLPPRTSKPSTGACIVGVGVRGLGGVTDLDSLWVYLFTSLYFSHAYFSYPVYSTTAIAIFFFFVFLLTPLSIYRMYW